MRETVNNTNINNCRGNFTSRKVVDQYLDKLNTPEAVDDFCTVVVGRMENVQQKVNEWTNSHVPMRRRAAYKLLCLMAVRSDEGSDAYFVSYLNRIEQKIQTEADCVKEMMKKAVLFIGTRNLSLNLAAFEVAKRIGRVRISDPRRNFDLDPYKTLGSARVKAKMC